MGQIMFRGSDSTRKKPPLLPLSQAHTDLTCLAWIRQLCVSIARLFRFAAPKSQPDSNPSPPSNFQDCVVEIQEPNFVTTGNRADEIGIERDEVQVPRPPVQPPPSTKTKKKKKEKQSASSVQYSKEMKILLVGEGDFSFSASLAVAFGDASNIVATSLNSLKFLKKNYANAATNIAELTGRGCKVMHGVDATKMARHPQLRSLKFDCIVYNFPHAGFADRKATREEEISKHQALVNGFLKNAKKMIKEVDGQIHITHKCIGFFLEWDLVTLGSNQGLQLVEETPFNPKHYPGYATKYGYGGDGDFDWRPSKTYQFQLSG